MHSSQTESYPMARIKKHQDGYSKGPRALSIIQPLLVTIGLFLSGHSVVAQAVDEAPQRGTGVSLLFGAEFGPLFSYAKDIRVETNKQGYALGGRAVLSLSTEQAVLEGGAGWLNSKISGKASSNNPAESGTESVTTNMGYAEAAGRYKLSAQFELGLLARVSFGTDSTFSTSLDADTKPNVFAGPQLIYDFRSTRALLSRVGTFVVTDISISERQIVWLGVNFDIGLALTKGDIVVKKQTKIKFKERNRYIIDADVVNFVTGKFDLSEGAQRYLETLGRFMVKNPTVWEKLVVSGHADQRGTTEVNEDLAQKRSESVRQILLTQGVPDERLVIRTFGSRDPLDDDEADVALARNRRVELFFVGKVNVAALRAGLIKVKQVAAQPETCVDEVCQ